LKNTINPTGKTPAKAGGGGAKQALMKRERAKHVAMENALLVSRMRRIITHSTPLWGNDDLGGGFRPVLEQRRDKQLQKPVEELNLTRNNFRGGGRRPED
jgi:hypothetical protein